MSVKRQQGKGAHASEDGDGLAGVCCLCACSMPVLAAQEQKIADQFATGVHTVDAVEVTFLHQVQSVECIRTFTAAKVVTCIG